MVVPSPGSVIQFRKGDEVHLARVAELRQGQLVGIDEGGKPVKLPLERLLQAAGDIPAGPGGGGAPDAAAVRAGLASWRQRAAEAARAIDLELIWETLRQDPREEPIERVLELYLGRGGSPEERLGLGFALCADSVYFKQKGQGFRPRMESEVLARKAQLAVEAERAERREAFLAWAAAGLAGGAGGGAGRDPAPARVAPVPAGAGPFLALLEDFAVRGEEASDHRAARALLREVKERASAAPGPRPRPPGLGEDAEGAFALLERLAVFGPHENLGVRRLGIPTAFPEDVLAEAEAVSPYRFDPAREPRREDLRAVPAVSIDNADTRDRDDAFALVPEAAGGFTLLLHHADPIPFVRPGSRLDEEALRRGTSVYLPTARYPMLPARISEGLMSLEAGADRPALTVRVRFDEALVRVSTEVVASVVRVGANRTYAEVDEALARGDEPFATLARLAGALSAGRRAAGALELNLEERELVVDPQSFAVEVRVHEARSPAHHLVAELAILANQTLAERLFAARAPAIYRRQDAPVEAIPPPEAAPSPRVWANEARRRLGRMELALDPGPHAALGLPCYLQATSPIRRYHDLLHHRQLAAVLAGERPPYDRDELWRLAGAAEHAAQEAATCERESVFYWLCVWLERYLRDHPKQPLAGEALGSTRDGRLLVHIERIAHRHPVPLPAARHPAPGTPLWVDLLRVEPRRGDLRLAVRPREAGAPALSAPAVRIQEARP